MDVIDLHDDEGLTLGDYEDCEFCDHEQIRFVHILCHKEYPEQIRVGCICACHLTEDYKNPKLREKVLRNRASKRARFVNRRWKLSSRGSEYLKLDGFRVAVGRMLSGEYCVWIDGKQGTNRYKNSKVAKLTAFDAVQKMLQRGHVPLSASTDS